MGSTTRPIKIAIIGGGIAGLALAAGLTKKPHLDVHVYEAVPEYKDVGAGLALHLNAIKAMALIGPEIRKTYFDKATTMAEEEEQEMSTEVILAQGPHAGELVAELGRAKGRKSVSRADLLAGLLELVPRDRVTFGKKLARIWETRDGDARVHIEFRDGTQAHVDCLLGAEGIHSVVRSYLLGADHPATAPKNHDRWQVYRTLVSADEARKQINEKWTRTVPILLGPRGHINCIPLNKGARLSAGVAVRGAVLDDGGNAKPLDPSLYSDYTEDAQRIVRMVAKDTSASWSVSDHDHAPFYHRGRIAMMGDAAHASLPFAGNGAAQALEDAAVLDHLFGRVKQPSQIEAALVAYDHVRRPRSQAVVNLARAFGRVYAYAEDGMHEDPEKMKSFFAGAAVFTNEADLKKQNDDAMEMYESCVRGRSRGSSNVPVSQRHV
ncbi:hypothetical protein B0T25DRAFT_461340 [Lasiosphaeria hispida]|uniref:FAD-binding domain-containing protein n=1 Tax=Lasiosphaeria hispida TaxID=260671 RepID=A0AAJ0MAQ6_9PEZI|nr:hypothetical protein B0T25DRAFT_461340 [Lasiosphaeria hispida]